MHEKHCPLASVSACQIEPISLICYPQVLRCFSEHVLLGGTSLKALFVTLVVAWKVCASLKETQMCKRPALFCGQLFFSWIGSCLPLTMQVMMSPRLFTFQGKIKQAAKPQQAYLVLVNAGPAETQVRSAGDWLTPTRRDNGTEHRTILLLRENKAVAALLGFLFLV